MLVQLAEGFVCVPILGSCIFSLLTHSVEAILVCAPSGVIVMVLARTLFWLIQTLLSPSDLMGVRCWSSCRSSISPETGFCSALVQLTEAWYVSWLIQPIVASL